MKKDKVTLKNFTSVFTSTGYSFEGKLPDEHVFIVVRKHWFVLIQKFLIIFFFAAVPFLINSSLVETLADSEVAMFIWFLTIMFYLYLWYAAFFQIMLYLMDIWIITDHRIIDSEQYWLFSRSVAELNLKNIQDISVEINGFFPTLLNFGNLEIQTAGAANKFFLSGVANPIEVKNMITKAQRSFKKLHPKDQQEEPGE